MDINNYVYEKITIYHPKDVYKQDKLDYIAENYSQNQIIGFRLPLNNERIISQFGDIVYAEAEFSAPRFILSPLKRYIFEETNKIDYPQTNDWYLTDQGEIRHTTEVLFSKYRILNVKIENI